MKREEEEEEKAMPAAANACLLLASLAGGALLVWWALEFHRYNRQLWMVPFGLILSGTPLLVWFSVSASDALRTVELLHLKPEAQDDPRAEEIEDLER